MADLASTDLTYSFNPRDKVFLGGRLGYLARGTISFGDGSLTYPSAGIPILKGKMGMPRVIKSLKVLETNALGFVFEYDVSAEKLRLFLAAPTGTNSSNSAGTASGNVAAPKVNFASASGNVAADLVVGLNALSNGASLVANTVIVNVTGVQAPAFTGDALATHSHTITVTATKLAEATAASYAPAACVLEVEAIGY